MEQELFGLITKLRDETSFINSEKKHLIELYKQVSCFFFTYFFMNNIFTKLFLFFTYSY